MAEEEMASPDEYDPVYENTVDDELDPEIYSALRKQAMKNLGIS